MLPFLATNAPYTQSMTNTHLHTSGTKGMVSMMLVFGKNVCECAFVYDCELNPPHFYNGIISTIKYHVFVSSFLNLDGESSFLNKYPYYSKSVL